MLSKTIDTHSKWSSESSLERKDRNRSVVFLRCFKVKVSVPEPEIEKANVQARVPERNSHVFNLQCRSKGRGRGGPCPPSFFPRK